MRLTISSHARRIAMLADYEANAQPDELFVDFADRLGHERFQPDAVLTAAREVVPA